MNRAFRALEEERHITKVLTGNVDLFPKENGVSEIRSKEAGEVRSQQKMRVTVEHCDIKEGVLENVS